MVRAERIALALLAAGRSSRFGPADKLAASFAGRPLIEWAARAGQASGAAPRLVVTAPGMTIDLAPFGYERRDNAEAEEGMGSSLRIAAAWAQARDAAALLILLADMPLIDADHLAALIDAFRLDDTRPIFSQAPSLSPQPPALFPARSFGQLLTLNGDSGARALADDATFIAAEAGMLIDIDTPADLDRAERLLMSR